MVTKRLGDIRLPYRHFERSEEIFVIRGLVVDVWSPKREVCHQETFGHRRHLYSTALLYFYVPHHHFAFLIQVRLSIVIKGQYAPRANPTPFSKSQHVHCRLLIFSIDRTPQGGVVYG